MRDPELIARNLDGFDRERPSLLAEVAFVGLEHRPSNLAAAAAVNISGVRRIHGASL